MNPVIRALESFEEAVPEYFIFRNPFSSIVKSEFVLSTLSKLKIVFNCDITIQD